MWNTVTMLTKVLYKKEKLKIAVIGTGIAGLSAAWLLNKRHEVVIYEKRSWVGGHANTFVASIDGSNIPVDTGFIVYNEPNYPNLTALFKHLNVLSQPSEMSFAASLQDGLLEYSGSNLNGFFGQRKNLIKRRFWQMAIDLLKFYREAPLLLSNPHSANLSIGEYLVQNKYGDAFINDHLFPMGSAIWSTAPEQICDYPAEAFIKFMQSHGLLSLTNRPQWKTVAGGSQQYVKVISEAFFDKIRFVGVKLICRFPDKVTVTDTDGNIENFDHVVVATHADEAYKLLQDPDQQEQLLLGKWQYSKNRAVLHTDSSFMPKRRRVWSSWNFINRKFNDDKKICVTYWMNRLQNLKTHQPLFVSLNPFDGLSPDSIICEFDYTHPYFDTDALLNQPKLWSLQGQQRTWYCGSYFGFGFHEDALQAGLAVAEQLGGMMRPWSLANKNSRISVTPTSMVAA